MRLWLLPVIPALGALAGGWLTLRVSRRERRILMVAGVAAGMGHGVTEELGDPVA